jgi:hypothetical protein
MGCCEASGEMPEEEYFILRRESTFGFHSKPCDRLEFAFKRFAKNSVLSEM